MQIDALYPKRFGTWTDYAKQYCNAHYRYSKLTMPHAALYICSTWYLVTVYSWDVALESESHISTAYVLVNALIRFPAQR